MPKAAPTTDQEPLTGRLSFEAIPTLEEKGAAEIAIYLDRSGLDRLMRALGALVDGSTDQVHLFSNVWGAGPLTIERWRSQGWVAHHLKVYLRPECERLNEVPFRPS